jgi:hypothetical protein
MTVFLPFPVLLLDHHSPLQVWKEVVSSFLCSNDFEGKKYKFKTFARVVPSETELCFLFNVDGVGMRLPE